MIEPILIAAVLDEKPENSKVCAEAREETDMLALKAFALVGSVTTTSIAELLLLTENAVVPLEAVAKSFNFPNSPARTPYAEIAAFFSSIFF